MCNEQSNSEGDFPPPPNVPWVQALNQQEAKDPGPLARSAQEQLEDDIEMYIEALHRSLVKYGHVDLVRSLNDVVVLYVQIKADREGE